MNKIINTSAIRSITNKQSEAIMNAFERYDSEADTIKVPQREHLASNFRKGVSCDHKWKMAPMTDECSTWFKKNFEEESADPGEYCSTCGATVLREEGKIWAYDATSKFYGKVPKERVHAPTQPKSERSR